MADREIPREQWRSFLDSFSRRHDGWLATVEIVRPGGAVDIEALDKPLMGVSAERRPGGEEALSILLGGRADDHVAHIVHAPVRLHIAETAEGADESLDIDTAGGGTTRLRFRTTRLPETLDGLVPGRT
jgi:Family of unknown function (DUF5335)